MEVARRVAPKVRGEVAHAGLCRRFISHEETGGALLLLFEGTAFSMCGRIAGAAALRAAARR